MRDGSHLCFTLFDTEKLRLKILLEEKLYCNSNTHESKKSKG